MLPKNPNKTDNYEILQWLAQDKNKYTGPEQIWIRGRTYYDDEFKQSGQYEASTVLTLGAGALNIEDLDLDHLGLVIPSIVPVQVMLILPNLTKTLCIASQAMQPLKNSPCLRMRIEIKDREKLIFFCF